MTSERAQKIIELTKAQLENFAKEGIPDHMWSGAMAYVLHGLPPGGFLTAILSNDFVHAASRADSSNAQALFAWAKFCYNAPIACWGTPEDVTKWIEMGGLEGMLNAEVAKTLAKETKKS